MTVPTILFFGYDHVPTTTPKVFLRTLLYSTSARGQVIEGMFVKLRWRELERTFSFWGYAEADKLYAGSGIHVSRTGFAANHHFVMSVHEEQFEFLAGDYTITLYVRVAGKSEPTQITTLNLKLDEDLALSLSRRDGVLFERQLDGTYRGHTRPQ